MLQAALKSLETAALTARSGTSDEARLRKEEAELLQRVLLEHYISASSLPAELAVDSCEGEIAETFDLLAQYMSERRGRVCKWHTPKIGDKRKIVLMAKRNAQAP